MDTPTTLRVSGMSCAHCVRAVEGALAALPGVRVERVAVGEARVWHDPAAVPREALVAVVEAEGYGVAPA